MSDKPPSPARQAWTKMWKEFNVPKTRVLIALNLVGWMFLVGDYWKDDVASGLPAFVAGVTGTIVINSAMFALAYLFAYRRIRKQRRPKADPKRR